MEFGIWTAVIKYLGREEWDQFSLKNFLPGNVVAKYQSDMEYAESFQAIIHNFFEVFFTRGVTHSISAFCWMLLCIAIGVLILICQKERREKKKVLGVNLCLLLMFCLYNLFLLWTYLTTMSVDEAVTVKCYDRYIGTYIIGWFGVCIYLLFLYHVGDKKMKYIYVSIFFLGNILGFLNRNTYLKEIEPRIREGYESSEKIKESISAPKDTDSEDIPDLWVSYANKEEILDDLQVVQLRYYLFPEYDFINIYGIQENYNREMKDIVAEFSFDYLVLYGVNDDFYHSYYWFFSDGLSNAMEQYENGRYQAYRIIRDETTNEFHYFEPIL